MIFFDLDGTLLDHKKAERYDDRAFQRFHSEAFPESVADFYDCWHAISEKHMNRFLNGEITEQGQRRERMRELFSDQDMTDLAADQVFEFYLQQYQESWCLFLDVMDS